MGKRKREFLLEFIPKGNAVKVSAVDTLTGVEVCIVGPAGYTQAQLEMTAVNKLNYVLQKKGLKC